MDMKLKKITSHQRGVVFIHLLVICIVFFLPDMMSNYARPRRNPNWAMLGYFKAALMVVVFYANYLYIIRHTLFTRRRNGVAMFVAVNVALIGLTIVAGHLMFGVLDLGKGKHGHELPLKIRLIRDASFYLRDLIMMVLTIAFSVALRFTSRLTEMEKKHDQLLAMQRADELNNLRHQLNPHFLFNTLNTIYSLVDISPAAAQDAVHRLSKLLRYMLYENPAKVRLSQEIDFVCNYISLMEERLGPGVVDAEFETDGMDPEVAPLIFITTVENALKYGNTGQTGDKIEIRIGCDSKGVVECRTRNRFIAKPSDNSRASGIGLSNLRRRLTLIYGDAASLEVAVSGDVFTSVITIDTSASSEDTHIDK